MAQNHRFRRRPNRLAGPVPARVESLPSAPVDPRESRLLALLSPLSKILRTQQSESRALVEVGAAVPAAVLPPSPPSADVALATGRELVARMQDGRPLEPLYPAVARLIANQERRAEIVDQILLTHEFDRAFTLAAARAQIEYELCMAAYRSDLSVPERLALLDRLVSLEQDSRNRIKAGATPVSDVMSLMKQAGALAIDEVQLASKFAKTTPQGREVVRKLALRLGKAARAAEGRK